MIIPYYTPSNICNICKDRSQYLFLAIKLCVRLRYVVALDKKSIFLYDLDVPFGSMKIVDTQYVYVPTWILLFIHILYGHKGTWFASYLKLFCRVIPLWCSYLKEFCFSIDFLLGKRLGFLFTRAHHKISSQSAK